ncbi:MAG TPA: hypothetical protein VGB14_10600 [Acidimicrobiales bacterium]
MTDLAVVAAHQEAVNIAGELVTAGGVTAEAAHRALEGAVPALALALAIDDALLLGHPRGRLEFAQAGALGDVIERAAETGKLNDRAPGALLWRHGDPVDDVHFGAVVRVSPAQWARVRLVNLPAVVDPTSDTRPADIVFGCAPVAMDLDEFVFGRPVPNEYQVSPGEALSDVGRVRALRDALDESGAVIGVLPESVLDDAGVDAWTTVLGEEEPPTGSPLRWILAGTGPTGGHHGERPPNRAVLFDRVSGKRLSEQDKRYGFQLQVTHLRDWQLEPYLGGDGPLDEYVATGEHLTILEGNLGRFAVLICEDMSWSTENYDRSIDALVRETAPSFIIVPVFDREITSDRWVRYHAEDWARIVGAHAIVSNSSAVARARESCGLIADGAVRSSAFYWLSDDSIEGDVDGQPGGGAGPAAVTLHRSPAADSPGVL